MLDPLIEFHLLLGVVFWLGCHQLLQWYWHGRYRQRLGQRRGKKTRYPPLPGLLGKPPCEHCAVVTEGQPERVPPPALFSSRGRPPQVNTAAHYCPNPACAYYGWLKRGNIHANGRPNGRAWRQLYCRACGPYCLETHGTLFYGKQHAPETLLYAIGCLAEGLGLRATARVFAIEAKTVWGWLIDAAEHSTAVSNSLLQDLRVSPIQLDELFARVAEWRTQPPTEAEAAEALDRLPRRPRWVWTAIDPISKVWLHGSVGARRLAQAQAMIHQLVQRLAKGARPLFLSDGLNYYRTALLTHFGYWWQPPRRSA